MKHVLILFTDQQRHDTIHALGNPAIQTPNLDALANDSVVFENCITPSPVCVPARLSLFAGQYPARTGCNNNNAENCYSGSGFFSRLTANHYSTCAIGKMHYLMDPYGLMGLEQRITQEEMAHPSDDYTNYIHTKYPHVFDYHGMRSEMYYVPQISPLPPSDHPTQWIGDRSVEYIQNHDVSCPMFLFSSFVHPHPPFSPPAPWNKLYRTDPPVPLSAQPDDLSGFWDPIGDRCSCQRLMMSKQDVLRMKNYYYACISFVDYQIGRIIQALKDKGMYEDTLIIFTSDHGDMMGDYGATGKRTMMDSSSHIPFIVHRPGTAPQYRTDPCSLVDIAPTVLSYSGIPYQTREYDGVDLFGDSVHTHIFSQFGCGEDGVYMVSDGSSKLVHRCKSKEYFFFDSIPEKKNSYTPDNPAVRVLKQLLDNYQASDRNKSHTSKSYEPYTKMHPHYPGRDDQSNYHDEEAACIPAGYTIDLG